MNSFQTHPQGHFEQHLNISLFDAHLTLRFPQGIFPRHQIRSVRGGRAAHRRLVGTLSQWWNPVVGRVIGDHRDRQLFLSSGHWAGDNLPKVSNFVISQGYAYRELGRLGLPSFAMHHNTGVLIFYIQQVNKGLLGIVSKGRCRVLRRGERIGSPVTWGRRVWTMIRRWSSPNLVHCSTPVKQQPYKGGTTSPRGLLWKSPLKQSSDYSQ